MTDVKSVASDVRQTGERIRCLRVQHLQKSASTLGDGFFVEINPRVFFSGDRRREARAQRDIANHGARIRSPLKGYLGHGLSQHVGDPNLPTIRTHGDSRRNSPFRRRPQRHGVAIGEAAFLEIKEMDDFFSRATRDDPLAIRCEGDPVKGFRENRPGKNFGTGNVHQDDLVGTKAGVKHRSETPRWINGHVHREISERDLLAHRIQQPLIGQSNRSIRAAARPVAGFSWG